MMATVVLNKSGDEDGVAALVEVLVLAGQQGDRSLSRGKRWWKLGSTLSLNPLNNMKSSPECEQHEV